MDAGTVGLQLRAGLVSGSRSVNYAFTVNRRKLGTSFTPRACNLKLFSTEGLYSVRYGPFKSSQVTSRAMGAMEEAVSDRSRISSFHMDDVGSSPTTLKKLVLPPSRADDVSIHNPLLRQHRLGCGWFAVIVEWEGVMVEDDSDIERAAWAMLAEEENKPQPMTFVLKRAEGMKSEQVISEVLCWTRDFRMVKALARRQEEIFESLQGGCYRLRAGSKEFLETLKKHGVPVAVVSTRPRKYLERATEAVGMEGFFNVLIGAEDVYRGKPDPEMFQHAAERLQYIPERCIVIGNSNKTVEAAHDALMKCVAAAGKHPVYELGAADLVVRRLDDLSVVDMKNLADLDSPEFQAQELKVEEEPEIYTRPVTFFDD